MEKGTSSYRFPAYFPKLTFEYSKKCLNAFKVMFSRDSVKVHCLSSDHVSPVGKRNENFLLISGQHPPEGAGLFTFLLLKAEHCPCL